MLRSSLLWAGLGLCSLVAFGCAGGTTTGGAASCGAQTPAQERAHADVVVDAVALAGPADPSGVLLSPARFRVLRYLKGRGPELVRISTAVSATHGGGFSYGGEGITPRADELWRIYGRHAASHTLDTSVCDGSQRLPPAAVCPRQAAQPLPPAALAGAVLAAVRQAPRVYGGRDVRGARATEAVLADDSVRGRYAGRNCGRRLQHRTVVVHLRFPPAAPSASLSEGVVLVSRFRGGYRVWARLH